MILTAETISQLSTLNTRVKLVDAKGNFLGYFSPIDPALLEPWISEEELQMIENSDQKRYTTAEVIAYLEKL
jgi:hypothetical protein